MYAMVMQKTARPKSVPVQGRLTEGEVAELDAAAAEQSVPVDRSTLISFILRKWLEARRNRSNALAIHDSST